MNASNVARFVAIAICATFLSACSTYSVIVSGESRSTNIDAVAKAQTAISLAEKRGCRALSIGSGAGAGVGVGLGRGLVIGDNCPECESLKKEQRELVEKSESIFVIHVLMECRGRPEEQ